MKAIFILSDSVNRRFLNIYEGKETAITPNIDRLAQKSVVFDNHWCGSSPCMPARRDIMTGRFNFLERPWGGIEPFDEMLPKILKTKNVFSHMETDHYHYFEPGGENYWYNFSSWNLHRGTEFDLNEICPDGTGCKTPSERPEDYRGLWAPLMHRNYKDKDDYPTPKTFTAAANWLEKNRNADNFMLWVEGFDPHEPYMVAQEFIDMYEDSDVGTDCFWPDYEECESYSPEQIRHLRCRYKALLTMTDHYIGKLLDVMDQYNMWEDTMVVFTTDHGFHLGEHGYLAKCYMPDYNETFHIPLIVHHPDIEPGRINAITQNVDMFPTMLELFGVDEKVCANKLHGKSILPLMRGETDSIHEVALYGVFGKTVDITDGKYTYLRHPVNPDNSPLHMYCAMPVLLNGYIGYDTMQKEDFSKIDMVRELKWTDYPVYKVDPDLLENFSNNAWGFVQMNRCISRYQLESWLFDIENDYAQEHPVKDEELEAKYADMLRKKLEECDCPEEQYERLGLQ